MLDWDTYFLGMARYVSRKSKDPSTKTGAVIVRPDRTVCSIGYNGFPRKIEDRPEWLQNREIKYELIIHCEMNALLHSREPIQGYVLYTYPFSSCRRCCVHMIEAGISRAVFPAASTDINSRWGRDIDIVKARYNEAEIEWREVDEEQST